MPSLLEKAKESNIKPAGPGVSESLFDKAQDTVTPTRTPQKSGKKESLLKRAGKFLIESERGFGESVAGAIFAPTALRQIEGQQKKQKETQDKLLKELRRKRKKGEDVSGILRALSKTTSGETALKDVLPATEKSAKQIAGEGAGVALDILSFGAGPKIAKRVVKPIVARTFSRGLAQGAKQGVKAGAIYGGGQSAARTAQKDQSGAQIASAGVTGALFGGVTGGAVGGVAGGIGGKVTGRMARKKELRALIRSGEISNARLGKYTVPSKTRAAIKAKENADLALDEAVKQANKSKTTIKKLQVKADEATSALEQSLPKSLKTDKVAKEAIRQGFDDADIAVIRSMSSKDILKAREMYTLADKASKNRRVIERPFDMVGESVLKPARVISKRLRAESRKLDDIAKGLKGEEVNFTKISNRAQNDLAEAGISVGDEGLVFEGSVLEGLGGNERIVRNVYNRIQNADDAFDLHRVKRYIDSNVEYGKRTEGLVGDASRLLKGWRHEIDAILDKQFKEYNRVNTVLSDTINQLDDLHAAFGKKLNVSDPLAGIRAGQVSSRILTNSPNRGEVIRTINNLQKSAKKYGYKSEEDVINQIIFADILEDVFGTQATRSLRGQVARAQQGTVEAVEGAVDVVRGVVRGNVSGAIFKTKAALDKVRGINQQAKRETLEALLGIGKR